MRSYGQVQTAWIAQNFIDTLLFKQHIVNFVSQPSFILQSAMWKSDKLRSGVTFEKFMVSRRQLYTELLGIFLSTYVCSTVLNSAYFHGNCHCHIHEMLGVICLENNIEIAHIFL